MIGNARDSFQYLGDSLDFRGFNSDAKNDYGFTGTSNFGGGMRTEVLHFDDGMIRTHKNLESETGIREEKLRGGSNIITDSPKPLGGKLPPIEVANHKLKNKGSFGGLAQGSDVGLDGKRFETSIIAGKSSSNIFSANIPGGVHNVMTEPLSSAGFGKKVDWRSGIELDNVYEEFGKLDEKQQKFVMEYLGNIHSAACEGTL